MKTTKRIAILGAGNIGSSIAAGLVRSGVEPASITLTRRKAQRLESFGERGFVVGQDNRKAVKIAQIVIISVEPQQIDSLLEEIAPDLDAKKHTVISVVSGVSVSQILDRVGKTITVVRAMPNTAISIGESMTCLAAGPSSGDALATAEEIFGAVGRTLIIDEEQMIAATALGACGIAFFLRAVRSASQGGIEIGFHSEAALTIAAQTAKGAAALLLDRENHPESEIDRVTTPRGCTIAGLNQMEHAGFSSAMIKGIVSSARKAAGLYEREDNDE